MIGQSAAKAAVKEKRAKSALHHKLKKSKNRDRRR